MSFKIKILMWCIDRLQGMAARGAEVWTEILSRWRMLFREIRRESLGMALIKRDFLTTRQLTWKMIHWSCVVIECEWEIIFNRLIGNGWSNPNDFNSRHRWNFNSNLVLKNQPSSPSLCACTWSFCNQFWPKCASAFERDFFNLKGLISNIRCKFD